MVCLSSIDLRWIHRRFSTLAFHTILMVSIMHLFISLVSEVSRELAKQKIQKRSFSTWHMLRPPTKEEKTTAFR